MIVVPFAPSVPDQQFTLQIGPSQYTLRALWNASANNRRGLWFFDDFEIDGTPIIRSVAIALGAFLGRTSTHPLFRVGTFIAVDTTGSETDAGLDDLGVRVEVRYYGIEEALGNLAAAAEAL
jgi:hypothetical protein